MIAQLAPQQKKIKPWLSGLYFTQKWSCNNCKESAFGSASGAIPVFSGLRSPSAKSFAPQRTPQQFFSLPYWEKPVMSNILFKLREPHSRRPTAVIAYYYYDGKRFVASTRRKISSKDWDSKRMRPKKSAPNAESLTAYLNSIQSAIIDRHNYLLAIGRYPSNEDFRQAIAERSGRLKIGRPTLLQRLDEECENAPSGSNYHKLRTLVKRFASAKRMPVQMDSISETWFNDFQSYLIANHADAYAQKMASQFKTVVRHTKFDWEGKAAVLGAKLKASSTPSEKVYLNFDELKRLQAAKLSGEPDQVRQMLFLACLTGLRISDWHKYSLAGDVVVVGQFKFIRIAMQKLRKQRGIKVAYPPLLPAAEKILKSFGGSFLPAGWQRLSTDDKNVKTLFNRQAREAARHCGFTEHVTLLKKRRGETVSETTPKWQEITSKAGRNSFVSNFRAIGTPDVLLNLMTGHSGRESMADAYDVASFRQKAPLLFPYLETFQERLMGGEVKMTFF